VTPCSVVVEDQRFGGPCCLHLQGDFTTRHHNPEYLDFNDIHVNVSFILQYTESQNSINFHFTDMEWRPSDTVHCLYKVYIYDVLELYLQTIRQNNKFFYSRQRTLSDGNTPVAVLGQCPNFRNQITFLALSMPVCSYFEGRAKITSTCKGNAMANIWTQEIRIR
jgi:hypothetical protein